MTLHRRLDHCPNCKREFYAHAEGAYCPECWSAWCRNDGSFERREKEWPEISAARALTATATGGAGLNQKEGRHGHRPQG